MSVFDRGLKPVFGAATELGFSSSDTHFEKRQQRVMVNGMGYGGQTNLGSKATSATY